MSESSTDNINYDGPYQPLYKKTLSQYRKKCKDFDKLTSKFKKCEERWNKSIIEDNLQKSVKPKKSSEDSGVIVLSDDSASGNQNQKEPNPNLIDQKSLSLIIATQKLELTQYERKTKKLISKLENKHQTVKKLKTELNNYDQKLFEKNKNFEKTIVNQNANIETLKKAVKQAEIDFSKKQKTCSELEEKHRLELDKLNFKLYRSHIESTELRQLLADERLRTCDETLRLELDRKEKVNMSLEKDLKLAKTQIEKMKEAAQFERPIGSYQRSRALSLSGPTNESLLKARINAMITSRSLFINYLSQASCKTSLLARQSTRAKYTYERNNRRYRGVLDLSSYLKVKQGYSVAKKHLNEKDFLNLNSRITGWIYYKNSNPSVKTLNCNQSNFSNTLNLLKIAFVYDFEAIDKNYNFEDVPRFVRVDFEIVDSDVDGDGDYPGGTYQQAVKVVDVNSKRLVLNWFRIELNEPGEDGKQQQKGASDFRSLHGTTKSADHQFRGGTLGPVTSGFKTSYVPRTPLPDFSLKRSFSENLRNNTKYFETTTETTTETKKKTTISKTDSEAKRLFELTEEFFGNSRKKPKNQKPSPISHKNQNKHKVSFADKDRYDNYDNYNYDTCTGQNYNYNDHDNHRDSYPYDDNYHDDNSKHKTETKFTKPTNFNSYDVSDIKSPKDSPNEGVTKLIRSPGDPYNIQSPDAAEYFNFGNVERVGNEFYIKSPESR